MRLGCFGTVKDIEDISKSNFDYIELNLKELVFLPKEQFRVVQLRLAAAGLGADACSWVMPIDADFTAPDLDFSTWRDYLKTGAERSASLGTVLWPLGSGKGRSFKPENGIEAEQHERFSAFVASMAEVAQEFGIQIAIEPLGPGYSNYLQTIAQAVRFVQGMGVPGIGTMCDLRHMTASKDPLSEITAYKDWILHTHIDFPYGDKRLFPRNADGYDYTDYFRQILRTSSPRLSVEALHEPDLALGADSVAYLRESIAEVRRGMEI